MCTALTRVEREQIDAIVPPAQCTICMAFHATIVRNGHRYANAVVALSEHAITFCHRGFLFHHLKPLSIVHIAQIKSVSTLDNHTVTITTSDANLTIISECCIGFVRTLLRLTLLAFPLLPGDLRFHFTSHDIDHFPPFRPSLSPSQQFQSTYNANCSYYNTPYFHDIPLHFHRQLLRRYGIFDFNELPFHVSELPLRDRKSVV
jgi:hypothetical protein